MEVINEGFSLSDSIAVCTKIEELISELGWHVAPIGGTLYKEGKRKDIDIMIYPHSFDEIPSKEEAQSIIRTIANSLDEKFCVSEDYNYRPSGRYPNKIVYQVGDNLDVFVSHIT